jgi:DNA-binding response OmpR family regulator
METESKNTTVFLIDDDDFLLEMYALKFKSAGFNVEIAKNAEDALEALRKGLKPDIVLLDIVMPKIDGFEFLNILKKEKLVPEAKLVILSNLGQKEDIEKGKTLGITDYIVKANLTPSEVVEKIKALL